MRRDDRHQTLDLRAPRPPSPHRRWRAARTLRLAVGTLQSLLALQAFVALKTLAALKTLVKTLAALKTLIKTLPALKTLAALPSQRRV